MSKSKIKHLSEEDIDRVIGMAWEDRTPFEAILYQQRLIVSNVVDNDKLLIIRFLSGECVH